MALIRVRAEHFIVTFRSVRFRHAGFANSTRIARVNRACRVTRRAPARRPLRNGCAFTTRRCALIVRRARVAIVTGTRRRYVAAITIGLPGTNVLCALIAVVTTPYKLFDPALLVGQRPIWQGPDSSSNRIKKLTDGTFIGLSLICCPHLQ